VCAILRIEESVITSRFQFSLGVGGSSRGSAVCVHEGTFPPSVVLEYAMVTIGVHNGAAIATATATARTAWAIDIVIVIVIVVIVVVIVVWCVYNGW
jgi:hypothetical protein